MVDVEKFLKKHEILESKSVIRGMSLEPEDNILFQQTTLPRIVKIRLKPEKPDNILYLVTDYYNNSLPDDMIEVFNDLIDYFNSLNFQHKLVLSLVYLEKEKSIVGTLISGINEFMGFKVSFNKQVPEMIIMNTYCTTEQMNLIIQDFIEEYRGMIVNKDDYRTLTLLGVKSPTGEIQPPVQLRLPIGIKKQDTKKKDSGESYTYF